MRLVTHNGSKPNANDCAAPGNSSVRWKHGGQRSQQWRLEEYLWVDGLACSYSVGGNGVVVHLPGRIAVELVVLRQTREVKEPKKWRVEGYGYAKG